MALFVLKVSKFFASKPRFGLFSLTPTGLKVDRVGNYAMTTIARLILKVCVKIAFLGSKRDSHLHITIDWSGL